MIITTIVICIQYHRLTYLNLRFETVKFFFFWSYPFPALTDALAGLPYRTGRLACSFALQDHSKEGPIGVAPMGP